MNTMKESQKKGLSPDQFALRVKAAALAGSMVLIGTVFGCTVGCSENTPEEEIQPTSLINNINGNYQDGEEKVFAPGEHYICVRISQHTNGYDNDSITGAAINNIPDGYEVYTILPYNIKVRYESTTHGYDIWFVNKKTVKAKASYNDVYKNNGYYTFGKVVEEEKVLEK